MVLQFEEVAVAEYVLEPGSGTAGILQTTIPNESRYLG